MKFSESPVGTLVLLHGLWLVPWRGLHLTGAALPLACCPPPPASYTNRAPFSRSQLLDSPIVRTDGTLTYFTFSVQLTFFTKSFFPHPVPRILFLVSLDFSFLLLPTVKGGPPAFQKMNKSGIMLWHNFFFCRFLSSNLFPPFGIGCIYYLKLHLIY